MTAYVISEVETLNASAMKQYRKLAAASIAEFGGRYLVRGAAMEVVEGARTAKKLVIVEFPTKRKIREWYRSPGYAKALDFRRAALVRRLVFVEGVQSSRSRS